MLLKEVCEKLYPDEELLLEMQSSLLDIEAKAVSMSKRHNIMSTLENKIKRASFKNEADALMQENKRRLLLGLETDISDDEEPMDEEG